MRVARNLAMSLFLRRSLHLLYVLKCDSLLGTHNFFQTEQEVECRIDHYQTPTEVHVSVFAKQTDQERSSVRIEQDKVAQNCG